MEVGAEEEAVVDAVRALPGVRLDVGLEDGERAFAGDGAAASVSFGHERPERALPEALADPALALLGRGARVWRVDRGGGREPRGDGGPEVAADAAGGVVPLARDDGVLPVGRRREPFRLVEEERLREHDGADDRLRGAVIRALGSVAFDARHELVEVGDAVAAFERHPCLRHRLCLGGFHFNARRYADDDLIVGTDNPFELFDIFVQILRAGSAADEIADVIDQSHAIEPKIEAMIQRVVNCQTAWVKALLVDWSVLSEAQAAGDVLAAHRAVTEAFRNDVRPLLRSVREEQGLPREPIAAHRESGYAERVARERGTAAAEGGYPTGS
jgi:hypothetical protein